MAVIIDIPGIGQVEAKNAASEATLKEILAAMKGVQANTKKKPGGGEDGGGGGGSNPLISAAGKLGQTMGKLSASVMPVIGGFASLSKFLTNTISDFANVGDSVESAAKVIPIFGGSLSKIAGASVKLNDAFLEASKSGASFGGSVTEFARSASEAGMTLEKFGQFISQNGAGMLAFGTTTEEGAKRFTQVSKALRQTSGDLYALGFSSDDINKGLANYGALLRAQGLQGRQSNAQLVEGAKKYLKELDALAKITGEERSVKEAEMKALATDAQFQAAMAGKDKTVRESFMNTVLGLPKPLQGFVKDFLATGTLTSEETQRIGAMMGGEVMNELQNMRNKMQAGQALTAAEQDRLAAIMKSAAEKQLKATGTALAASRENDSATLALTAATTLQTDAHKKAAAEQAKSAKEGDGFNKKMQEIQQRLAQLSNAFTQVLAKSGILDVIIGAFTVMANLVSTFIVPAFNILSTVVSSIAKFIGSVLYPAFLQLAGFVIVDVIPKLQAIGKAITETVTPVFQFLGGLLKDYVYPAFQTVSSFISDNLVPIFYGLATSLAIYGGYLAIVKGLEYAKIAWMTVQNATATLLNANLAMLAGNALRSAAAFLLASAPLIVWGTIIAGVVVLFKKLYDSGWSLTTAWDGIKDNLERFGMHIVEFIDNIRAKLPETIGGLSKEEKKLRDEAREQRRKELDDKETARDDERKKLAQDRKDGKDKEARQAAAAKLDSRILSGKEKYAETIEKSNKTIDYNAGPEALLKQFATTEGSPLVPKDKKEAAAKAETTKKEVEKKGEEKAAAEKKAAEEKESKKKVEEGTETEKAPIKQPVQESAESLLAQLNSNMSQLIRISQEQKDIGERQLSVQRSLTKDLFVAV